MFWIYVLIHNRHFIENYILKYYQTVVNTFFKPNFQKSTLIEIKY